MAITTLTNGLLQKRLQIANCCAAKKGYDIILKQNKGIACRGDEKKVQLTLDLIDSLTDYIDISAPDEAFDDTDRELTTIEIETILDKLCSLCSDPCTTYVNFES